VLDDLDEDPRIGLANDTIWVTGASSGIGEQTARLLGSAGARVVLSARSEDRLADLAEEIQDAGGRALAAPADVTEADEIDAALAQAREWAGSIDHVAHVAGYPLDERLWDSPLHELDQADFDRVREVDLEGARRVTQAALPDIRETGGAMVYISSTPAISGYKGTPYTEAKAAVLGLMRDVAREYGDDGVRANALALGNIGTEATVEHTTQDYDELAREAALGRWGQPAEAAAAIAWFLSPMASFVTGQTLVVDGGAVMR